MLPPSASKPYTGVPRACKNCAVIALVCGSLGVEGGGGGRGKELKKTLYLHGIAAIVITCVNS